METPSHEPTTAPTAPPTMSTDQVTICKSNEESDGGRPTNGPTNGADVSPTPPASYDRCRGCDEATHSDQWYGMDDDNDDDDDVVFPPVCEEEYEVKKQVGSTDSFLT